MMPSFAEAIFLEVEVEEGNQGEEEEGMEGTPSVGASS